MKSRSIAPDTTAQVVGSSVITEALRRPPSSANSPTYSPGPWVLRMTSLPASLAAYTLTAPLTMMNSVSDWSPSVISTACAG
jgi:hypothetical protein